MWIFIYLESLQIILFNPDMLLWTLKKKSLGFADTVHCEYGSEEKTTKQAHSALCTSPLLDNTPT